MLKNIIFFLLIAIPNFSCKHTPVSQTATLDPICYGSQINDGNTNYRIGRSVGKGSFGKVYGLSPEIQTKVAVPDQNKFFRFFLNKVEPVPVQRFADKPSDVLKVLKISQESNKGYLLKFYRDEDLMASLPGQGLPFPTSKRVRIPGLSMPFDGYIKPYFPYSLELLAGLKRQLDWQEIGTHIASQYKKISEIQSGPKKIEGILISDIGLYHGSNSMFKLDKNKVPSLTFIDMQDFISNFGLKVQSSSKVHDKKFLEQWIFLEAVPYIYGIRRKLIRERLAVTRYFNFKDQGNLEAGLFRVFDEMAAENSDLKYMMNRIKKDVRGNTINDSVSGAGAGAGAGGRLSGLKSWQIYAWKIEEMDRLMQEGMGGASAKETFSRELKEDFFLAYAPTDAVFRVAKVLGVDNF